MNAPHGIQCRRVLKLLTIWKRDNLNGIAGRSQRIAHLRQIKRGNRCIGNNSDAAIQPQVTAESAQFWQESRAGMDAV